MKGKRNLLITGVVILAVIVSLSGLAEAQSMNIIKKITVEGNDYVSDFEILNVVKTETGDEIDQEVLKDDLQAVYDLGYFQDINISFENYQDGVNVIFSLVENPVLKEIDISGYEKMYKREQLIELLGVNPGTVLNVKEMNQGLKRLQEKMQDDGYILARFKDVNVSDEGVLMVKINPGYLNEIIIKGNEKTDRDIVLRQMPIGAGNVVNINKIQKGYQNLYKLGFFEKINPELERVDNEKNTVNLVINLTEGKTGRFHFGGGYSSKDGWIGFVDLSEKNLMGNGQTLGFKYEFGESTTYSVNFYDPWIFGSDTSFGINVYDDESSGSNLDDEFTESRSGGSISLGRPLANEWKTSLRYRLEDSETTWAEGVTGKTDEASSIRSLTWSFNRDTSDDPFNPNHGGINIYSIEYAGDFLGGDENFSKLNAEIRRYYPGFKADHAWALRIKGGLGYREDIPFAEEYRLGGSENLRGYERNSFHGDNMLLLGAEYRIPINENFTGVLFSDAGNTWNDKSDITLDELNYSLGLGVRMNTPLGQLRLDYGWNDEGDGMPHFSIGQTF